MFSNTYVGRGATDLLVLPGSLGVMCISYLFIPFLGNLVQGLNSTDPAVQEKAIAETEKRLHDQETCKEEESKTMVNRTVINTQASVRGFFPLKLKLHAVLGF